MLNRVLCRIQATGASTSVINGLYEYMMSTGMYTEFATGVIYVM